MGKGSKWRETDYKKYYENWENIKSVKPGDKSNKKNIEVVIKNRKTTYKYK